MWGKGGKTIPLIPDTPFDTRRERQILDSFPEENMTISDALLEILACPRCKGALLQNDMKDGLICRACGLLYPIRDGIPVMLEGEAAPEPKHP